MKRLDNQFTLTLLILIIMGVIRQSSRGHERSRPRTRQDSATHTSEHVQSDFVHYAQKLLGIYIDVFVSTIGKQRFWQLAHLLEKQISVYVPRETSAAAHSVRLR